MTEQEKDSSLFTLNEFFNSDKEEETTTAVLPGEEEEEEEILDPYASTEENTIISDDELINRYNLDTPVEPPVLGNPLPPDGEDIIKLELGEDDEDEEEEEKDMNAVWQSITTSMISPEYQSLVSQLSPAVRQTMINARVDEFWDGDQGLYKINKFKNNPTARARAIEFNNWSAIERRKRINASLPDEFKKEARPGEIITIDNGNSYKYEVGIDKDNKYVLEYYTKIGGEAEWVRIQKNETQTGQEARVALGIFDHHLSDEDLTFELANKHFDAVDRSNLWAIVSQPVEVTPNDPLYVEHKDVDELGNRTIPDNILPNIPFEWDYEGDENIDELIEKLITFEGFVLDPKLSKGMNLWNYILKNTANSNTAGVSLENVGPELDQFLRHLENTGSNLNDLMDTYIKGQINTAPTDKENMQRLSEFVLYKALISGDEKNPSYVENQGAILNRYVATNFFKYKMQTQEGKDLFQPIIDEANGKLKESIFEWMTPGEEINYENFWYIPQVRNQIVNELKKELKLNANYTQDGDAAFLPQISDKELGMYILDQTWSTEELMNYKDVAFPIVQRKAREKLLAEYNMYKKIEKNEGVTPGDLFREAGELGVKGFFGRLEPFLLFGAETVDSFLGTDAIDTDPERIRRFFENQDLINLSPQVVTGAEQSFFGKMWSHASQTGINGNVATIDGVEYILYEGQIFNKDLKVRFVPNPDGDFSDYFKIQKALEESEEKDSMWSAVGFTKNTSQIGATLAFDIMAMRWMKSKSNALGQTAYFKKFLTDKLKGRRIPWTNIKINPKMINIASLQLNTGAYYGLAFGIQGYNDAMTASLVNGLPLQQAKENAEIAGFTSAIWGSATSIFLPTDIMYGAGNRLFKTSFAGVANEMAVAAKTGGTQGASTVLSRWFQRLSPNSQKVANLFYNTSRGMFGEQMQETGQQAGQKLMINRLINFNSGKQIVSQQFGFNEFSNVWIYSGAVGGVVGAIMNPDVLRDNAAEYNYNLYTLSKDVGQLKVHLNNLLKGKVITQEISDQMMKEVIAMKNWQNKIPLNLVSKPKDILDFALLMEERSQFEHALDNTSGKAAKTKINKSIEAIDGEIAILLATSRNVAVKKFMNSLKQDFKVFEDSAAIQAYINNINKNLPKEHQVSVEEDSFGSFITVKDAEGNVVKEVALINSSLEASKGFFTTGQHEGFHGLLSALAKKHKANLKAWEEGGRKGAKPVSDILKMASDVISFIESSENVIFKNPNGEEVNSINASWFIRLKQYLADPNLTDETVMEEVFPLLSESLTNNWLEYKEDENTKIDDKIRRIFRSIGINFAIGDGQAAFDLIRDYNYVIETDGGRTGLFSPGYGLKKIGKGNVDVTTEEDSGTLYSSKNLPNTRKVFQAIDALMRAEGDGETSKSSDKKSSKNTQGLSNLVTQWQLDNTTVDIIDDILPQYVPAVMSSLKRWGVTGGRNLTFDLKNPEVVKEIQQEAGKQLWSFLENFNAKKSDATTYTDNIAKRIGPAVVEILANPKGKRSLDQMRDEKGFDAQTDTQVDFDQDQDVDRGRDKKYISSIPAITKKITENILGDIIGGIDSKGKNYGLKTTKGIGASLVDIIMSGRGVGGTVDPENLAKAIIQITKNKEYLIPLRKLVGKWNTAEYNQFVDDIIDQGLIGTIPASTIKRRLGRQANINSGLIDYKIIGKSTKNKVKDGKKTTFKPATYEITKLDKTKLKEYYKATEKRQQSLFSMITEGVMVEGVSTLQNNTTFMNKLNSILEMKNSPLSAIEFMTDLEQYLDQRTKEDTSLDRVTVKSSKQVTQENWFKALPKESQEAFDKIFTAKSINGIVKDNGIVKEKVATVEERVIVKDKITKAIKLGMPLDMFESFALKYSGANRRKNPKTGGYEYETTDGTWVPGVKNKGKSWSPPPNVELVPNKGRVYWGDTDPDYITAKKDASNNPSLFTAPSKKVNIGTQNGKNVVVTAKWINGKPRGETRTRGEIFAQNMKNLGVTAQWLATQVAEGKMEMSTAALLITQSYQATGGGIKIAAAFKYIYEGLEPGMAYREEHNPPASTIGGLLIWAVKNNVVEEIMPAIKENYWQSQIPIAIDVDINNAGYKMVMPSNTNIFTKSAIRLIKSGLNINKFKGLNGSTLAEDLKLPLKPENQTADNIEAQNNLLDKVLIADENGKFLPIKEAQNELEAVIKVNNKSSKQVDLNNENLFNLIPKDGTTETSIKAMSDADTTMQKANSLDQPTQGISVFDFDDTLAFSDSKVIVNMPYYSPGSMTEASMEITPAEFAERAVELESMGAAFDFSQFNQVVNGRKGPLADLALKRQGKFGSGDIFVLTARPQISDTAIQMFLKGIGLDIPLSNITGLENGTPEAKALWVLDKTARGYNDFYFADDSLANVQAVKNILDQVDVKSKVQQAKSSKSIDLNREFNQIIEQQSGKEWFKTYSPARAKVEGKGKNKFEFFIPPSAEDFVGLLYKLLPKGKEGDQALFWFKDNLLDPFNKAEQLVIQAKMAVANDFKALRDSIDNIPKNLNSEAGYSNFTWSQALRVYIWGMQGNDIPGLSSRDKKALTDLIKNNADMKVFAEKIAFIQKGKNYPTPKKDWVAGTITSDIIDSIQKVYRKEALQEWIENKNIIFSPDNMQKLEALYGSNFVVALKDMLGRMERGSNRPLGNQPQVDNVVDWLNNSVGTVMFLNRKSALLQLISSINFINWTDNNLLEAGKALVSKEYWPTVIKLMNSDYLVNRRNGLKINVAESEIAEASKKGGFKGVVAYLLNKGFIFTRIADSLAIATGGATFFINRTKKLKTQVNLETGKLYTQEEAETKAFNDFYQISEESQQSSRTDRISMQQASGLGRLVLNFANTPMQYARIIKKATADLLAGRGDWRSNVSKIVYYGAMQNLIFNALQQALWTLAFVEDDEEKKDRTGKDRAEDIGFGMLSSLLRGLGYGGALLDTVIAVAREIDTQSEKKSPDYEEAVWSVFDFSPSVDSKVRKLRSAANTYKYNKEEIYKRGFNLDNPAYLAVGQVISATLNIPLDQALRMTMSIKQISDKETEVWQKVALALGYSSWSLGLPYWGTLTTIGNEMKEAEAIKVQYKNDSIKLKRLGYRRRPMTKGKPDGKLGVDYIEVSRPSGDTEYWLTPKK